MNNDPKTLHDNVCFFGTPLDDIKRAYTKNCDGVVSINQGTVFFARVIDVTESPEGAKVRFLDLSGAKKTYLAIGTPAQEFKDVLKESTVARAKAQELREELASNRATMSDTQIKAAEKTIGDYVAAGETADVREIQTPVRHDSAISKKMTAETLHS